MHSCDRCGGMVDGGGHLFNLTDTGSGNALHRRLCGGCAGDVAGVFNTTPERETLPRKTYEPDDAIAERAGRAATVEVNAGRKAETRGREEGPK